MAAPGHIGFYRTRDDPIGQFQTLLYLPDCALPETLVELTQACFGQLPMAVVSEAGSASALLLTSLDAALPVSVKMVDRINPNISWYYRLDSGAELRLRGFAVGPADAELPFTPDASSRWAETAVPGDWKLCLDMALEAGSAT